MAAIVALVGLFLVAMGLWGLISPVGLVRFTTRWQSRSSLWISTLLLLLFGVALWFAAPHAAHPVVFKVLAPACVAAMLLLAVARVRIEAFGSSLSARPSAFVLGFALTAVAVGAYVLWALLVPLISSIQDISNLATIAGIGIGATWAIYTWWHQESLRKIKENPGLEFGFSCSQESLPDGRVLVTVDCSVRNTGVWPIFPIVERASFRISTIPFEGETGFLEPDGRIEEGKVILCARDRQGMRLEPQTTTVFTAHYLAAPKCLYWVTFTLPSEILREDGTKWDWIRRRVIYVPERAKMDS
jgi:hypothetical protein